MSHFLSLCFFEHKNTPLYSFGYINTLYNIDAIYHVGNSDSSRMPVQFNINPMVDFTCLEALKEVMLTTYFNNETNTFFITTEIDGIENVVENHFQLLSYSIVGVQPMSSPTGQVFNVKHRYKDDQ